MCGIFGLIDASQGKSEVAHRLNAMASTLEHRGPDAKGIAAYDGYGIGNTRLSIIAPEGGQQPFSSESGDVVVVQNGEIFNYIELRLEIRRSFPDLVFKGDSDTEVILRSYQAFGPDFVSKLNGMFSIAIIDRGQNKVHLYRDRFGIKPLFVAQSGATLAFASEMRAITQYPNSLSLNEESVSHFLILNYIPSPNTIYKEIQSFPAGHVWSVDLSDFSVKVKKWWQVKPTFLENATENDWVEETERLLKDSVRIRMRCDTAYGAFLSGGVDSSLISSIMTEIAPGADTFCIGFDHERYDETEDARLVAAHIKSNHRSTRFAKDNLDLWPTVLSYCEQPHGDTSFIPTYLVNKFASDHVKVVLSGDGADELFAGYRRHGVFSKFRTNSNSQDPSSFWLEHSTVFNINEVNDVLAGFNREHLESLSSLVESSFDALPSEVEQLNRFLYCDLKLLLEGNNLIKPDRMGMAHSIEARAPFLDYRLVELALGMPESVKIKDGQNKYVLRKILNKRLPLECTTKQKKMFAIPIAEWLNEGLLDRLQEEILGSKLVGSGILEAKGIQRIIGQHRSKTQNRTREVRALAALSLWSGTSSNLW